MMILTLLLACADPTKDKSIAKVEAPKTEAAPAPAAAAPAAAPTEATKPVDAAPGLALKGKVGFVGAKVTKEHEGSFGTWTGAAVMEGTTLKEIRVKAEISSLTTGVEKLDNHLKSPDFFDAEKFPQASFVSTAIKAGAPADSKLAGATHTVEGDLTMHGITKHLTFPAIIDTAAGVKAKTEFGINRKDFGIEYPGKPDDLIKDEVLLKIDVEGA